MKDISVINAPQIAPSVSLIIPTDKSYPQYRIDEAKIKSLLKTVESELLEKFSEKKTKLILDKLNNLVASIDHKHLSRAIALFVSPEKEKLFYLPFPVREKFIIDTSFEIRDLLYSTKNSLNYLLVLLVNQQPKVYQGYNNSLVEIEIEKMPLSIEKLRRDYPTKVANFSDLNAMEEINLDKYLKAIDDVLSEKLKEMDISVIICGVKKTIGIFKKITNNYKRIIDYVEGSYNNSSKQELYNTIEPALIQWREDLQKQSLLKLEDAINRKEYVYGIENVWRAAMEKKGRLLIVEKDFVCPAKTGLDKYKLNTDVLDKNDLYVIRDAVDDTIELVLKNKGDIAFVDNGKLDSYKSIALITRY